MINISFKENKLETLQQFPSEFIDLIYIHPPFFRNGDYNLFSDMWKNIEIYMIWVRPIIEQLHRVLKKTGSFYLHCNYYTNAYLRVLCNEIFGSKNFRNEIVWTMGSISGFKSQKKVWIRNHDTLLYYTKSNKFTFNKIYLPYSWKYIKRFTKEDENGKYIVWHKKRHYLKDKLGIPVSDVWHDIKKPKALLERIIQASSNEGDVFLDVFAGIDTTLPVAKKLHRKWMVID